MRVRYETGLTLIYIEQIFGSVSCVYDTGLACVFRQPNADHSHCHLLHGYSLAFKFTFGCKELDNKNWAVDFGGLKPLKAWLEDQLDHKLCLDIKNNNNHV